MTNPTGMLTPSKDEGKLLRGSDRLALVLVVVAVSCALRNMPRRGGPGRLRLLR